MAVEVADETRVDLSNCDQEPIHIPGRIQPHGALLVLDPDGRIRQASSNLQDHFGLAASDALGQGLSSVITTADAGHVLRRIAQGPLHAHPIYLQTIRGARVETAFDAIAHQAPEGDGRVVLELEPVDGERLDNAHCDLHQRVQGALADVRSAPDIKSLCDVVAKHVRKLNGFDRVMVYRFDADWNGQVISEDRRTDIEPFLGLNYPASDIPPQARALYAQNWLRFIANRDYAPADLTPSERLDMSQSVLRSVSPIHLEYLRNMKVAASMSISIVRGSGKAARLWGLIACHHYAPRRVPFEVRTSCELIGQMLSMQVETREASRKETDLSDRRQMIRTIVRQTMAGSAFGESLTQITGGLMGLLGAGGAAVVVDDVVTRIGQTPGEDAIREILARAVGRGLEEGLFATDALGKFMGSAQLDPVAGGLLLISFERGSRRSILWFRPEVVRTVDWAGDPAKSVTKGDEGVRLSPRGSFALWKETVRGRSLPWSEVDRLAALELRREVLTKVLESAASLAESQEELRRQNAEREAQLERERAARTEAERSSRMKDDFVATLSHELRTPLNAIQGWTQLLRSGERTPEAVDEALAVIDRNARAQAQMVEDLLDMSRITSGKIRLDVQPVDLAGVVEAALDTVRIAADVKDIRIHRFIDPMNGVIVTGDPQRLQQVFWNLLSNAVKFTPRGGRIRVELQRVGSHVELSVHDNGAGLDPTFLPHVFDRFRQADASSTRRHGGLGLGLAIVRHLVELHGGTVSAESSGKGKGATFTVSLPVRALTPKDREGEHPSSSPLNTLDCDKLNLSGVRALVVDDEPDARELVKRLLQECGVITQTAGSAGEARDLLEQGGFDVIVSDIGMPGEDGFQMIRALRDWEASHGKGRTPAVALTAYARPEDRRKSMLAGFQVHVSKPVEAAELLAVVASLTGRV